MRYKVIAAALLGAASLLAMGITSTEAWYNRRAGTNHDDQLRIHQSVLSVSW
jgi:hypothetical protein